MTSNKGMVRELGAGSLPDLECKLDATDLTPGWIKRERPLLWREMKSDCVPAHWSYRQIKPYLEQAGRDLGTDQAERRNFIMRNPIPDNNVSTLHTMIGAYQTILPGERAMSHRHSPHAMRVILEANGAYSIVNGHKHPMESGDIVLTPGGSWHGHGHEGDAQAFWFDGLDVPLAHLLEPMFYEPHPAHWEPVTYEGAESPMRFAWADTQKRLASAAPDATGHFGVGIDLDTSMMPTLKLQVLGWASGWRNRPFRHTANDVYVVMLGAGRSTIGEKTFNWSFGDTFVAPGWSRIEHQANADSVLCRISDEALMHWTKYYRVEAVA